MKKHKETTGILLYEESYNHIGEALKSYIQEGPIGKFLYCDNAEQNGSFLCMTFHPSTVGGRIKDSMEVSIPIGFVKFLVKSSDKKSIGFEFHKVGDE